MVHRSGGGWSRELAREASEWLLQDRTADPGLCIFRRREATLVHHAWQGLSLLLPSSLLCSTKLLHPGGWRDLSAHAPAMQVFIEDMSRSLGTEGGVEPIQAQTVMSNLWARRQLPHLHLLQFAPTGNKTGSSVLPVCTHAVRGAGSSDSCITVTDPALSCSWRPQLALCSSWSEDMATRARGVTRCSSQGGAWA